MRLGFGYFWLETGIAKVQHVDGFAERFASWNIPFPLLSATVSAWTDLVGGALLMLGLFTRLISVPMLVNMLANPCRGETAGRAKKKLRQARRFVADPKRAVPYHVFSSAKAISTHKSTKRI